MIKVSVAFIGNTIATHSQSGTVPGRFSRVVSSQSYSLRCAGGMLLAIHLSVLDTFWQQSCSALDEPDLRVDPGSTDTQRVAATTVRSRISLPNTCCTSRATNGCGGSRRSTCRLRRSTGSTR